MSEKAEQSRQDIFLPHIITAGKMLYVRKDGADRARHVSPRNIITASKYYRKNKLHSFLKKRVEI